MDFDKTSFSVDWFAPGDGGAPKRLSFPKSACMSIDDLVSDSPLSFCFSPVDEAIPRSHSYSFVDTPFERACGWTNSAPPSPLVPPDRGPYQMYGLDPKTREESSTDWRALASPGLLSVADDCASCGVDLDVSCLDALDEELLLEPMECFTELCWAAAVHDEVTPPVTRRNTRSRAHSFKCDYERTLPPLGKDYPGSFERTRPLAAKISLPLETLPHYLSPLPFDSHDRSSILREKALGCLLPINPEGHPHHFPTQGIHTPRRSEKRDLTLTPSFESLAPSPPSKACLQPSKPRQTLRVISDAYSTFARSRRKSPH